MSRLIIGRVYNHPEHGPIYIIDGAYERNGRVSNAWNWKKINNGTLMPKIYNGYGGDWPEIKAKITHDITVQLPKNY